MGFSQTPSDHHSTFLLHKSRTHWGPVICCHPVPLPLDISLTIVLIFNFLFTQSSRICPHRCWPLCSTREGWVAFAVSHDPPSFVFPPPSQRSIFRPISFVLPLHNGRIQNSASFSQPSLLTVLWSLTAMSHNSLVDDLKILTSRPEVTSKPWTYTPNSLLPTQTHQCAFRHLAVHKPVHS